MAETARLGDLQRETIIRLRDLYLRNVGILARRRKQLTAALQVGARLHRARQLDAQQHAILRSLQLSVEILMCTPICAAISRSWHQARQNLTTSRATSLLFVAVHWW